MPTRYRILVVLLGALLVVGCQRTARKPPSSKTIPPAPSAATEGLNIGQIAPEIDGVDLDGNRFRLSDYRGKVVLLDFWGHW